MDRRGDYREPTVAANSPAVPLHGGPRMQPVGGEHALAVEHPTRSRFRTADPAVGAANDCVQPQRDRPRRERHRRRRDGPRGAASNNQMSPVCTSSRLMLYVHLSAIEAVMPSRIGPNSMRRS